MLARKRNEVTDLGKVLDPMADSVTHISLFFTFTQGFVGLPMLIVFVFLYRDFLISTLRTLCALRGVALAARFSGKIKAFMQAAVAILIIVLMIPYTMGLISLELFQQISLYAVSLAALYTAVSFCDYIYANWVYIKKAF
jgi:CDP-diacylglycerol--glycerol-3-phosphate 3-phosphatidyltransferase